MRYRRYAPALKFLTLVLFLYVATAFTVHIPWGEAFARAVWPAAEVNRDYLLMVVAVLGTTISPYLFFWQASQEVEEMKQNRPRRPIKERRPLKELLRGGESEIERIALDTTVGMAFSNIIAFFIILTTAAVLNAGGMTSRTSAHLTSQSDDGFKTVIQVRGLAGAKTFYESHAAAIDRIETIAQEERIECHFRRVNGYLFPAIGKDPSDELTPEFEATKKVEMPIERHTGLPFKGLEQVRSLRYPNLATFHPLRYLRGVADSFVRRGGELFANTTVTNVEEKDEAVTVRTADNLRVEAANAVIATNSPINDRFTLHTQLAPYRTYAMAITIERDSIEDALYWDTLEAYHYVRLENGRGATQYLIVGGADHKTGEADDAWARFEGIESWIRALLPKLGNVTHRWSGQILDPVDYAAFIGRNPGNDHVFVHTGDSGQGLTHGVAGSLLLSRLISASRVFGRIFMTPLGSRLLPPSTLLPRMSLP